MIALDSLKPRDKSRYVYYVAGGGDKLEMGAISSWNDCFIFVRYDAVLEPEFRRRVGQTAEATSPEDLFWSAAEAHAAYQLRRVRRSNEHAL